MLFDRESKMSENGPFLQQGESDERSGPTEFNKKWEERNWSNFFFQVLLEKKAENCQQISFA